MGPLGRRRPYCTNIVSDHLMLLNLKICGRKNIFFSNYNSNTTVWVDSVFQLLGHCFCWIALPCASESYLSQSFISQQRSAAGDDSHPRPRETKRTISEHRNTRANTKKKSADKSIFSCSFHSVDVHCHDVKDRKKCSRWQEECFHPLCHQQSVERRVPQSKSCLTGRKASHILIRMRSALKWKDGLKFSINFPLQRL